jgi:hypothetical protein
MEPAGAERHRRAGRRPNERERTSQTAYNSRFRIVEVLYQTPFGARRREHRYISDAATEIFVFLGDWMEKALVFYAATLKAFTSFYDAISDSPSAAGTEPFIV